MCPPFYLLHRFLSYGSSGFRVGSREFNSCFITGTDPCLPFRIRQLAEKEGVRALSLRAGQVPPVQLFKSFFQQFNASTFQPFFCNSSKGFDSFRKNDEINATAPTRTKNFIKKGKYAFALALMIATNINPLI